MHSSGRVHRCMHRMLAVCCRDASVQQGSLLVIASCQWQQPESACNVRHAKQLHSPIMLVAREDIYDDAIAVTYCSLQQTHTSLSMMIGWTVLKVSSEGGKAKGIHLQAAQRQIAACLQPADCSVDSNTPDKVAALARGSVPMSVHRPMFLNGTCYPGRSQCPRQERLGTLPDYPCMNQVRSPALQILTGVCDMMVNLHCLDVTSTQEPW